MNRTEEVIDATLEADGALRLAHPPQLPPGPVRVTIQAVGPSRPRRTLADVIREIRLALQAGPVGDWLRGLALQLAELALDDDRGERPLLLAIETRQLALQEAFETLAATAHARGRDLGVRQEGLGRRVFEDRPPCHLVKRPCGSGRQAVRIPSQEKSAQ